MSKAKKNWKADYEAQMSKRGFSSHKIGQGESRQHPRLAFRTGTTISVQTEPIHCQIVNISVGGISFYSDVQLPEGQAITITLEGGLSLTLRVDSFHVEELPPVLMVTSHKYLIGARFLNEQDGYRVVAEVLRNQGQALFALST
jgi:hypothetical protein